MSTIRMYLPLQKYLKMLADMTLSQTIEDSTSLSHSLPQNLMNKKRKELMKEAYYCAPIDVKLEVTTNEKQVNYTFMSSQR